MSPRKINSRCWWGEQAMCLLRAIFEHGVVALWETICIKQSIFDQKNKLQFWCFQVHMDHLAFRKRHLRAESAVMRTSQDKPKKNTSKFHSKCHMWKILSLHHAPILAKIREMWWLYWYAAEQCILILGRFKSKFTLAICFLKVLFESGAVVLLI